MPGPSDLPGQGEETVYLSLGGNLGDPASAMAAALQMLDNDEQTRVTAVSSLYRTAPWGRTDQPDFINACAELSTSREPRDFLELCLDVERRLKRVRQERWGPRLIDIDVLTFGRRIVQEPGLDIPHPRMLERAFVVVPLAEIAPDMAAGSITVRQRAATLDRAGIERLPAGADWWRARSVKVSLLRPFPSPSLRAR